MWMAHKNKRIKVINIQAIKTVSQIFLSFLFIFSASFFFGYFLGWSVGGGSVEGVRGPVRKVVHGLGS